MTQAVDTRTPRARAIAARRQYLPVKPVTTSPIDPTLAELSVAAKYHDELAGAGINRLSQLEAYGDLTAIKGIGPKGAEEIRAAVAVYREQQSQDNDT